jgi:hypothetical protein
VQRHGVGVRVVGGDQQELVGARERGGQRGGVGVVAAADLDAAVGEGPRRLGVAGDDDELRGGDPLEQVLGGGAVERAGGSGDGDNGSASRGSGDNRCTLARESMR